MLEWMSLYLPMNAAIFILVYGICKIVNYRRFFLNFDGYINSIDGNISLIFSLAMVGFLLIPSFLMNSTSEAIHGEFKLNDGFKKEKMWIYTENGVYVINKGNLNEISLPRPERMVLATINDRGDKQYFYSKPETFESFLEEAKRW